MRWHQSRGIFRGGQSWSAAGALAVLLAAVSFAFWPVLVGRETFWFFDVPLIHHPNNTVLKQALAARDLSAIVWNPKVGAGFSLWAEGQIGPLYLPNWILLLLFDSLAAYNIGQVLHYFLAAVFTYAYARALGLRRPSAVVVGLAFTFGGHLVGAMAANTILRSAIWLPLMFWGMEKFAVQRKFVHLATVSAGIAMQVLAGYPATAVLGGLTVACYGVFRLLAGGTPGAGRQFSGWRGWTRALHAFVAVGVAGVVGLGLASAHLAPQLELVSHSQRIKVSYDYATTWSLPPFQLGTLVWPFMFYNPVERVVWGLENFGRTAIYVGIVPLALAVVAIFVRRRPRWVIFFIVLAPLALVLAMGRYTPLYRLMYLLPGFHNFRAPSTFGYVFVFSLAVLAGYGMDRLLSELDLRLARRLAMLSGVLLALVLPILACQVVVQRWAATGRLVEMLGPIRPWMRLSRDPALLVRSIQASADPRQATAFMPIVLLAGAAGWLILRRTHLHLNVWAWCGVGLVAVDLVFFAATIRETQVTSYPVAETDSWAVDVLQSQTGIYRTAVTWCLYPWTDSYQANRLMADGVSTLQVYVQLSTERLGQYLSLAREHPEAMSRLLGLANVHLALDAASQTYAGVPFIVKRPLAEAGLWRDAQATVALPSPMQATSVQLIFAETSWRASDTDGWVQVTLVGEDGQEQSWMLADGPVVAADPEYVPVRLIDQPALRDPLSWNGEDFSVQDWPLYYAEVSPTMNAPVARVIISPRPQTNLYLLGLSVASTDGRWEAGERPFHQDGFRSFYQHPHGAVYRVEGAMPRAYVVRQVRIVPDAQTLRALVDPSFDPRHEALVVEGPDPAMGLAPVSDGSGDDVRILDYRPMEVEIAVDLAVPGLLVLTDLNYPGWQVFVDGARQPIVSTNYLFRGVYVGEGQHDVRFVYAPMSLRIGIAISLAVAIGVLGLTLIEMVRGRRR